MAFILSFFQFVFAVATLGYAFRLIGQFTRGWNFTYRRQRDRLT